MVDSLNNSCLELLSESCDDLQENLQSKELRDLIPTSYCDQELKV